MVIPELITFIRTSLDQGETVEQIKEILFSNGWTQADVQEGLWAVQNAHKNDPEVLSEKLPQQTEKPKTAVEKIPGATKKKVWPRVVLWVGGTILFVVGFILAVVVAGASFSK